MAQGEQELKYQLSESAYGRILELCQPTDPAVSFSNMYFQAAEPVERADWVLRLRRSEGAGGELTLKLGREVSPGMFRSTEYTAEVQSDEVAAWQGTEPLRVFFEEVSPLLPVFRGASHNIRQVVLAPLGPVARWELDRTSLPDASVFHELEIEWEPDAEPTVEEVAAFRAELEEWFVSQGFSDITPSRKTKYRRFLDSLGS